MTWLKLPWRGRAASDELDPDLLATFEGASRIPEPARPDLVRAHARIAANLTANPAGRATGGGLRQRLALAAFGGGGMWASLAGVAAAHKLAAIGLGVAALVGAGTVAQTGGLDAILDATGIQASEQGQGRGGGDDGDGGAGVGAGAGVGVRAISEDEGGAGPASDSEATVGVSDAPDDLPGNLVTQIHKHSFTLRALLCAIDEGEDAGTVTLATTGDCDGEGITGIAAVRGGLVTLALDDEATVSVPGTRSPNGGKPEVTIGPSVLATLNDYTGRLAFVRGTCESIEVGDVVLATDCTVTSIHVLGRAGQGVPDGAAEPQGAGEGGGNRPDGDPPFGGPPEGVGGTSIDDDDNGPPDGAGKPDSIPPTPTPGSQGD